MSITKASNDDPWVMTVIDEVWRQSDAEKNVEFYSAVLMEITYANIYGYSLS